ncbi:MAG: hypothetical protein GF364_01935, partial [Candidatus Lokiarchaeota archaeon]|nr:hypothetical protein [Candidatus Lokiarchaeota archaeon]
MSMNVKITISFNKEINSMLNQIVQVDLKTPGEYYKGELSGYNLKDGALSLINASNEDNERFTKVILHGDSWSRIYVTAPAFPMKELAEKIAEIFPSGQVKYDPESNTINILNGSIIVNEGGVEGAGLTAK